MGLDGDVAGNVLSFSGTTEICVSYEEFSRLPRGIILRQGSRCI